MEEGPDQFVDPSFHLSDYLNSIASSLSMHRLPLRGGGEGAPRRRQCGVGISVRRGADG